MSTTNPQAEGPSPADIIAMLPACALNCLQLAEPSTTCNLTDGACRCSDAAYNSVVGQCVSRDCTIPQALTARNLTSTGLCGVEPYVDHSAKALFITFTALAVVFVGLRFLARRTRTVKVWWDDFCALLSLVVIVTMLALTMKLYELGLGADLWSIPRSNITTIFLYTYVNMGLYGVARVASRVSIMLFYFRIFAKTPGHRLRKWVLILDVGTCVPLAVFVLFPCRPVSYFWTRWDGEHLGSCIDLKAETLGLGIKDIIVDVIIISLPLPYIAQLQLSTRKKMMSLLLFSIGLGVIAASAARVASVDKLVHSVNPTVDTLDFTIISHIELCLGIICACLPSVKPLISSGSRYIPSFLKATQSGSSNKSYPYGGGTKIAASVSHSAAAESKSGTTSSGNAKKIRVTYTTAVVHANDDDRNTTGTRASPDENPLLRHPHMVPLTDLKPNGSKSRETKSPVKSKRGPYAQYSSHVRSGNDSGDGSESSNQSLSWDQQEVQIPRGAYMP